MKTKHILTALALPAMFAACTADDIEGLNNGVQQQAERAKLSKDFVLNTNNEVESRYVVEGSTALDFIFEEGDLIGANLIDQPFQDPDKAANGKVTDPATWQIVDYVAPALPFENIGENQWKSAGELGVGNYLFTNPYNPADKNRSAAKYELPIVVQYDSENPNAHIEAYNKAVAATILREDDTAANISLKNLYTYPKIRISFPKEDEVSEVTKVILTKGENFIYKGVFDNEEIAHMFNPDTIAFHMKANDWTEEEYWESKQTADFVLDADELAAKTETSITADMIVPASAFVYEMTEKVTANSIEVRLMIPSVKSMLDLSADNLSADLLKEVITMYICTDKGNYKFEVTDVRNYTFKGTTLAAVKDKALWRNKSNTLTVNSKMLDAADDATIKDLLTSNIVSTAADWNALVEAYGDLKKYSDAYKKDIAEKLAGNEITEKQNDADTLYVTIVGNEFALTSDLKMPEIAEFVIQSDVNVEGNVTLKNVEISKPYKDATAKTPALIVKEGAILTTDQTFEADSVMVEENAELVFTAAYDAKKKKNVAYTGVAKIENEGTVTVPAGVEATFTLNNTKKGSVLNVGAAASRAEAVAKANLQGGENNGTINNYGEIVVNGTFDNEWASDAADYETDEDTGLYTEWPIFLNEGTVEVKGIFNNNTEFVNNNTLTSNTSGSDFYNKTANSVLKVKAGASTIIDSNAGGTIILGEKNPTVFTIHDAKGDENYAATDAGTIKYTASATELASLDLDGSPVTYLIANGNVNLVKTNTYTTTASDGTASTVVDQLPTLELNSGDVKVAVRTGAGTTESPYVYAAKVKTLYVASGKNTISSEINTIEKIEIEKNASLELVEGSGKLEMSTVNVSAVVKTGALDEEKEDEAGIFYVNGDMKVTSETLKNADGELKTGNVNIPACVELGKDVTIETVKGTVETNAEKLENGVEGVIKAFATNSNGMNSTRTWDWITKSAVSTAMSEANKNVDWVKAANDAFKTAAGVTTDYWNTTAITNDVFTAAKEDVKAAADAAINTTIQAQLANNSWLIGGTIGKYHVDVYKKTSKNQAIETIVSGAMVASRHAADENMVEAFVNAIKALNHKTIGGDVWLSINDSVDAKYITNAYLATPVTGKNSTKLIPAYSYVETYTDSDLYKAIAIWKQLTEAYGYDERLASAMEYRYVAANATMKGLKGFYTAVNTIDTTGESVLALALKDAKAIAATVMTWTYLNEQIAAYPDVVAAADKEAVTPMSEAEVLMEALATTGEVTLTSDVVLEEPISIVSGSRAAGKKYVIDLNGYKLVNSTSIMGGCDQDPAKPERHGKACAAIYVNNADAEVLIKGDGTVKADADDADYNMPVWVRAGNVTIESGTFVSAADKNGAQCHAVYAMSDCIVNIKGGVFENNGTVDGSGMSVRAVLNGYDNKNAKIYLSGGKFKEFGATEAAGVGKGEVIILSNNYKWSDSKDGNGYWSVVKK